jgi:hypothetical protein
VWECEKQNFSHSFFPNAEFGLCVCVFERIVEGESSLFRSLGILPALKKV